MKLSLLCSFVLALTCTGAAYAANPVASAEPPQELVIKPIPAWVSELKEGPKSTSASALSAPVLRLVTDDQFRLVGTDRNHFYHQVELVQSAEGLTSAGQVQISYDPTFQKLTMHRVEVIRDGRHINQLNRQTVQFLHRETELEKYEINGLVTASVILSDIRLGDRIDLAYSVDGSNPVFENKFADIRTEGNEKLPVSEFRYRLLYPSTREIRFKVPERLHTSSSERDGVKEVVFTDSDVPQMVSEVGTTWRDYNPQVLQLSEWRDWDEITDWGTRLFDVKGTDTPALEAKRRELAGQSDPVLATVNFVQKDIRYFAREIGFNTHRPTAPDKVIDQRSGDCKDKVMLLIALLSAEGIEAKPVLVNMNDPMLDRDLPSPLAFNHVVTRVTIDGTSTIIDATRDSQTGPLREREAIGLGKGLLLAKSGDSGLIAMPNPTDKPSFEATDEIDIPHFKDGATIRSTVKIRGFGAEFVRMTIAKQPKEFGTAFLDSIMRSYPGATIVQEPTLADVPDENAVTVTSILKVTEPFESTNFTYLSANASFWAMVPKLRTPSMAKRVTSYDLGPPILIRQTLHYTLGEAAIATPQQSANDYGDSHLTLHTQYDGKQKDIRLSADMRITSRYVEPQDWEAFSTSLAPVRKAATTSFNFTSYPPDAAAKLTAEINRITATETAKKTAPTEIKLKTANYMLEQILAADRLTPLLRARVDMASGVLLENQNQCLKAHDRIVEASTIAPNLPEAYAVLASNDFCLNRDDEAIAHLTRALELKPNDAHLLIGRGEVKFGGGHYDEASADFREAASHLDASQVGPAVTWLCLASVRQNKDCKAAIQPYLSDIAEDRWPGPAIQYLLGKKTLDSMMGAAKADTAAPQEVADAYFFSAEKQLVGNARADAMTNFRHVGEIDGFANPERVLAERELSNPQSAASP